MVVSYCELVLSISKQVDDNSVDLNITIYHKFIIGYLYCRRWKLNKK